MNLTFKFTKYEPTAEILAQARKQIGALDKFVSGKAGKAELELERAVGKPHKGDIWRAELMVRMNGKVYRAESTKAKLSHALTTVARDVGQELRRAKGKDSDISKKGGSKVKNMMRGLGKR
ncbi:MAG: HPF/RaiA family ribosome-associated protein [Minisyncoccia bacterium]